MPADPQATTVDERDWVLVEDDNGNRLVVIGSHIYPRNEPIRVRPASVVDALRRERDALRAEVEQSREYGRRQWQLADDSLKDLGAAQQEVARLQARIKELEARDAG